MNFFENPIKSAIPVSADLHPVLIRQLRHTAINLGLGADSLQLSAFLERVSRAYHTADQDRYLLERSLETSSREMADLYQALADSSRSAIAEQRDQLRRILDSAADGILTVDDCGQIMTFNRAAERMFGFAADDVEGHDLFELLNGSHERQSTCVLLEDLVDNRPLPTDVMNGCRRDGSIFPIDIAASVMQLGESRAYVAIVRDISERVDLQRKLEHQAFHDHLTDLPNRALLRDRLSNSIARSHRSGMTVALLFGDLDGFKLINDTLGHDTGDVVLIEVGRRLLSVVRDGDTVARFGGDEFAVLLDESSPGAAEMIADRMLEALREPFIIGDRELFVRISIGIADNCADSLDANNMLSRADIAMYAAKARGRDRFEHFEPQMHAELSARHELYGDLRNALQNEELILYYQPLTNLASGTIESVEALIRWNHPTRGQIGPNEFIPIAEETGLIDLIGRYVLREACRQLIVWQEMMPDNPNLAVAVNVSARQLYDPKFVSHVEEALHENGLKPEFLTLELTESALLTDTKLVQERLRALKDLGIRIAIDDFGTGYSSLAYLRTFPVDFLKIDRSFVNELSQESDQGKVMIRSIIGLGHNLGLTVVAEGIEDSYQLDELRDAGCNVGQGFLLARPSPVSEITSLLKKARIDEIAAPATKCGVF